MIFKTLFILILLSFSLFSFEKQTVYYEDTNCSRVDFVGEFTAYTLEENIKVYEKQDIRSKVIKVLKLPIYTKTKHKRITPHALASCHDLVRYKKGKDYDIHLVDMFTYGFSQIELDDNKKGYVDKDIFYFEFDNNKKLLSVFFRALNIAKKRTSINELSKHLCNNLDKMENEVGQNRLYNLGRLKTKDIKKGDELYMDLFSELFYSVTIFSEQKYYMRLFKAVYGEHQEKEQDVIYNYFKVNSISSFAKLYAFDTIFKYIFEKDPKEFISKINKKECSKLINSK